MNTMAVSRLIKAPMRTLFDLSFRSKIPLWGGLLMVVTALAISSALLFRAYDDMMQDMRTSSDHLGRVLANTLFPALLHDDIWRAYELINTPFRGKPLTKSMHAEVLLVVDPTGQIIVSTQPEQLPMLAPLEKIGPEYAALAAAIATIDKKSTKNFEFADSTRVYFAIPIAYEETQLGTLVLVYPRSVFMARFFGSMWRAGLAVLLVLAVLLPLNWYWGQRMAIPLVQLAGRMEQLGVYHLPDDLDPALYPYRDELGRLFEAYHLTLNELRKKALLEKEIIRSERLAAVGHLTAGIAHEINNPLAGILTAINTLKLHGDNNPRSLKTIALIERGLLQIKETVGALLVEARVSSRFLSPHDIDDVHTLMQTQARKKNLEIEFRGGIVSELPLPANLLRQMLINLLLNAVQAANENGVVWCEIGIDDGALTLEVGNDGQQITQEQREHLFEPFATQRDNGHGLGLWVTYQIVQKLDGCIIVSGDEGFTCFAVHIPLGAKV